MNEHAKAEVARTAKEIVGSWKGIQGDIAGAAVVAQAILYVGAQLASELQEVAVQLSLLAAKGNSPT